MAVITQYRIINTTSGILNITKDDLYEVIGGGDGSGGKFIDGTSTLDAVYLEGNVGVGTPIPNYPFTVINSDSYTSGQHIIS